MQVKRSLLLLLLVAISIFLAACGWMLPEVEERVAATVPAERIEPTRALETQVVVAVPVGKYSGEEVAANEATALLRTDYGPDVLTIITYESGDDGLSVLDLTTDNDSLSWISGSFGDILVLSAESDFRGDSHRLIRYSSDHAILGMSGTDEGVGKAELIEETPGHTPGFIPISFSTVYPPEIVDEVETISVQEQIANQEESMSGNLLGLGANQVFSMLHEPFERSLGRSGTYLSENGGYMLGNLDLPSQGREATPLEPAVAAIATLLFLPCCMTIEKSRAPCLMHSANFEDSANPFAYQSGHFQVVERRAKWTRTKAKTDDVQTTYGVGGNIEGISDAVLRSCHV